MTTTQAPRLAYRVRDLATKLGVSTRTIERAIKDGRLKSSKLGVVRLVEAESVRRLFKMEPT